MQNWHFWNAKCTVLECKTHHFGKQREWHCFRNVLFAHYQLFMLKLNSRSILAFSVSFGMLRRHHFPTHLFPFGKTERGFCFSSFPPLGGQRWPFISLIFHSFLPVLPSGADGRGLLIGWKFAKTLTYRTFIMCFLGKARRRPQWFVVPLFLFCQYFLFILLCK